MHGIPWISKHSMDSNGVRAVPKLDFTMGQGLMNPIVPIKTRPTANTVGNSNTVKTVK